MEDSECIKFSYHCCNKGSFDCAYCGISTENFTKQDWDERCPMNEGVPIQHQWYIKHVYGYALTSRQDYGQTIVYECRLCNNNRFERDNE